MTRAAVRAFILYITHPSLARRRLDFEVARAVLCAMPHCVPVCYVRGGEACPYAEPSEEFPGAFWVRCEDATRRGR